MMRCCIRLSIAVLWSIVLADQVIAQPVVPEALEPWRDWVLYGQEYRACPVLNGSQPGQPGNHICAWPGELRMDIDATGAQFELEWRIYAETWVPLPGDRTYWPTSVAVDGTSQAVVDRAGVPSVRLGSGERTITGALTWVDRPASINVPQSVGLVRLVLDDAAIPNPDLEDGTLWLGLREGVEQDEDRLDVQVYRLLSDGLPIGLETRIQLNVAGQGREQALVGALPDGFTGEALRSPLPALLDPDGTLRVQLRPGTWELRLTAHATTLLDQVQRADRVEPWPADEVWSYAAAPRLRVTALEGLESVDGGQAGVPRDWLERPAYRAAPGEPMTIAERSRNDASEPNRLSLARNLWLDFDGRFYTAEDRIGGSMGSAWRLDMAAPYLMTMAETDGESLLVTEGPGPGLQGVEVRDPEPAVRATARLPAGGPHAVSGYAGRFDRVDMALHLPPGYRLLAAPGADNAAGAWIERWRLLDLFLVLIITVSAWRLFGMTGGVIALAALALTYHEPAAPRWVWLNVLLAIAVARVAPAGRLQTFATRYRFLSLAAVGLLLIPFVATQLRVVVFPQFERPILSTSAQAGAGFAGGRFEPLQEVDAVSVPAAAARPEDLQALRREDRAFEEVTVTASRIGVAPLTRFQPGALVQTGPGLPDWVWNRYRLSFSGPVDAEQTYRLILLSPWQSRLWRVAGVVLALGFIGTLLRGFAVPAGWFRRGAATAIVIPVLGLALAPDPADAQATNEFPSQGLLEELRNRLTEPAACHPQCAALATAAVAIDADAMTVVLNVATQDAVAVPLPAASEGWQPQSVLVDGVALALLYRSQDGRTWLRVEEGVHEIELTGVLAPVNSFSLGFPLVPHAVDVDAEGWDVAGVVERRLPSGAVELVRQRTDGEGGEQVLAATVFPPYVRVRRQVTFDLDWLVRTEIERVAPAAGAFTLDIDLLQDESILTPGIEVEDGQAIAAFTAQQPVLVWESRLPLSNTLTLSAAADVPWAESWSFTVSPIWHADYEGFPATPPEFRGGRFFSPEYHPRPGESLTVALTRPAPASGDTIAIDNVEYERNVGQRSSNSSLYFEYRSTQGGDHAILLPEGSELESVAIDDEIVPLELDGNRLELQKIPGEHDVEIVWRDLTGVGLMAVLPKVDLGGGASNLYSYVNLPADRWILFTYGPTLGPAILYWAELAVFVLAALVLGRLPMSQLKTHEWLLLGLGLSTFAWPVLFAFTVWVFVLAWRQRSELHVGRRVFNLVQILLAAFTIGTIIALVSSIPIGLLGAPDMQISSPVPGGRLSWFSDRSEGLTDGIGVVSVSLWFYKAAMLAWALWLSFGLLRWLRWAWTAYSHDGLWRGKIAASGAESGTAG